MIACLLEIGGYCFWSAVMLFFLSQASAKVERDIGPRLAYLWEHRCPHWFRKLFCSTVLHLVVGACWFALGAVWLSTSIWSGV